MPAIIAMRRQGRAVVRHGHTGRHGGWRTAVLIGLLQILFAGASTAGDIRAAAARVTGDATSTTFEIDLSEGVTAEVYTLANPYRVIIDLPDVGFDLPAGTGASIDGKRLISAFRYGLFAERKARVVIDTPGPTAIAKADMVRAKAGVTLRVVLKAMDAQTFGVGTGASRRPPTAASPAAEADPATPKKAPRAKPIIVIDPGHGGVDPGALGRNNVAEKTIVLAVGQALKAAFAASGRYDVRMTRTTDVFVSLDKRLQFSADQDADLFISLHADSIEEREAADSIRGATVYTLSDRASDEQARRKAEKENAADRIAGLDISDSAGSEQVKNILIDLLKRETLNFSTDFSNLLVKRLAKAATLSRDPQRSAAFKVLKQTHAPSVLLELGYMSNPKDESDMMTPDWQKRVAGSIALAVDSYFSKRTAEHP
ncbi:MAG: N-acetylmuramoyl-L-alanine amidase [Hyphomicrobium sp.]